MTEKGLLRQQRVIQAFGIMMLLSPIVNLFLSIYPVKNPHKWTWPVLKLLLNDISSVHWILWSCSVIIGLLMLKGKRDSWISVLGLLSLFIFYNLITLKSEMQKTGVLPVFLLLCNIGVFVVVYMAEFNKPISQKIKNLAKIISVEGPHLIFNCYTSPPLGIQDKAVEILVGNLGLILTYVSQKDSLLKFKCHEVVYYRQPTAA